MASVVRRRPASLRTRGVVASVAGLLLVGTLSGCDDGAPEIAAIDLSSADASTCQSFAADLPADLGGEKEVEATGDTDAGAAWGDPAVVLTCGVAAVDLTAAPPCTTVDGVGWVVQESDDETVFTADGYRPRVQVVVPHDYDQPAGLLTALSPLVRQHLRLEDRCLW